MQAVGGAHRLIGKALYLLKTQLVRAEVAKHHPAAGGAKINSGHPSAGHCVPFDKLRTAPVEARSLT